MISTTAAVNPEAARTDPDAVQQEQVDARHDLAALSAIVANYDKVSGGIIGLAAVGFTPLNRHALGMRELRGLVASTVGMHDAALELHVRVVTGLGFVTTIPALFWSSEAAYEQAAFNLAMFHGFYADDGQRLHDFVERIFDNTAVLRADLVRRGAFVGYVPLRHCTNLGMPKHHAREYYHCWRAVPDEVAFYFHTWTETMVFFREGPDACDGNAQCGSVAAADLGFQGGRCLFPDISAAAYHAYSSRVETDLETDHFHESSSEDDVEQAFFSDIVSSCGDVLSDLGDDEV